jgi:hypothetical protein
MALSKHRGTGNADIQICYGTLRASVGVYVPDTLPGSRWVSITVRFRGPECLLLSSAATVAGGSIPEVNGLVQPPSSYRGGERSEPAPGSATEPCRPPFRRLRIMARRRSTASDVDARVVGDRSRRATFNIGVVVDKGRGGIDTSYRRSVPLVGRYLDANSAAHLSAPPSNPPRLGCGPRRSAPTFSHDLLNPMQAD